MGEGSCAALKCSLTTQHRARDLCLLSPERPGPGAVQNPSSASHAWREDRPPLAGSREHCVPCNSPRREQALGPRCKQETQ